MFGLAFVQQFLAAARPELEVMIQDALGFANKGNEVLVVPYEEAGRRLGTSYEGIRKLVRKGDLIATSRGRRRGIAVSELERYVQQKRVVKL